MVGAVKYLAPFALDGNQWLSSGDPIAFDVSAATPSSVWTEYSISVPLAQTYAIGYLLAVYSNADASLKYRKSSTDSTNGRSVAFVGANSRTSSASIQLETNSLNKIWLKWDTATTNSINFYTIGFVLPDYIYTRPAGGIYRQIDETVNIVDETYTNIDHTIMTIDNTLSFGKELYGMQTIRLQWVSDSTVKVLPGVVHSYDSNDDTHALYSVNESFDTSFGGLSPSTWYSIYTSPPESGVDITTIYYDSTMPVEDSTNMGWYHPNNVAQRCIGFIRSDQSSRILQFDVVGNKYVLVETIVEIPISQLTSGNCNTSLIQAVSLPMPHVVGIFNVIQQVYNSGSS